MGAVDREVVLVTEYFHPDTASTGQLLTELAVGLRKRGLPVTVFTSQPNYHSGENQKQPSNTHYRGVPVKRIRAPQVTQSSVPKRVLNWTIFVIWMTARLLLRRTDTECELLFVTNPPVLPIAMWVLHKARGWDYTYVVYDLYPDVAVELGYIREGGVIHAIWARLHRRALADANHVVALGPVMRNRLIEAGGGTLEPSTVAVIHNWEDESFITPKSKEENAFSRDHGLVNTFSLLYSGNIGKHHELSSVVRATEPFDGDIRFLIIGEGEQKSAIVELAEELDLRGRTIEFLPYQPIETLPSSLTCSDVTVVSVRSGFNGLCVSSKLYTALAAGQPILLVADRDSDEARIVDEFDAGIRATPGDSDEIVAAIERWRSDPDLVAEQGENARTAFEDHFTRTHSIDAYYRLLSG